MFLLNDLGGDRGALRPCKITKCVKKLCRGVGSEMGKGSELSPWNDLLMDVCY